MYGNLVHFLIFPASGPQMFPQAINLASYEDAYYLQFKTVSDITTWQINYDSPVFFPLFQEKPLIF